MYCRGGLCLIGRSRRLSFNSIAIMPSVPRWDGSPMTEKQQPECTISPMALAFFVVFDGVRIAKRGELGVQSTSTEEPCAAAYRGNVPSCACH